MARRKQKDTPKKKRGRPRTETVEELDDEHAPRARKRKPYRWEEEDSTQRGLLVIALFGIAAIAFLSFIDAAGDLGVWVDRLFGWAFGWGRYVIPAILVVFGYVFLHPDRFEVRVVNYIGVVLFLLSGLALLHLNIPLRGIMDAAQQGQGGGYVGLLLAYPLMQFAGIWVTIVVLIGLFIASWLIMFNMSLRELVRQVRVFGFLGGVASWFRSRLHARINGYTIASDDEPEDGEEGNGEGSASAASSETLQAEDNDAVFSSKEVATSEQVNESELQQGSLMLSPKRRRYGTIDIPLNLLTDRNEKPTSGDIEANKEKIRLALENFGIPVEMGDVSVGPMVSQYTLKPAEGVKLTQITTLHNDIALALAAHPIRIEAPIPGKSLVGIEVPNKAIATVTLKEMLEHKHFKKRKDNLTLALGKDVGGKPYFTSLQHMPHLLIAGATGSGKSVCINSCILSLVYQNSPNDLRLVLVDPKRVELTMYNGIPHLLTPVITDVEKTVNALKWTVAEMDRRYELLSRAGKRNIESYNVVSEPEDRMPYIVFIIDELADLMSVAANSVEAAIVRLAQMSRAVGIHLILATQRPSVNVITGLIKANMPARIAFSVASLVDSRTILDFSGAEKLLGRGDMLYIDATLSKPKRVQGAFLDDKEIERVAEYLRTEHEPDYNDTVVEKVGSSSIPDMGAAGDASDDLLDEAKKVIFEAGKASASLLQRRLRVGYARAARILDILEEQGFIGPADGAKPREILVTEQELGDAPDESLDDSEDDGADDGDASDAEDVEDSEDDVDDGETEESDDFATEDDDRRV